MIKTVEEIAKIIELGIECDHTTNEIARQIVLEVSNEIDYLKLDRDTYMKGMIENRKVVIKQEKQIESLKAITELAVKGLKRVINIEDEPSKPCIKCNNHGYHHGFGSDGRDPDYCAYCGGLGEIFVGQTEVAADTLSEIERLTHAQT